MKVIQEKYKLLFVLSFVFFIFFSCKTNKNPSKLKREFSFCKETNDKGCIPPLLSKEVIYNFTFDAEDENKKLRDYLNKIYFEGDTLSFELKFNKKLSNKEKQFWKENFKAYYKFSGNEKKYPIRTLTFANQSVHGFDLIGYMLEKKYKQKLDHPFFKLPPIRIYFILYLKEKKIGYRSITLYLKNI